MTAKWENPYKKNSELPIGIMRHGYDELTADEFYRGIFGNELDEAGEFTKGKYTGIALELEKSKTKKTASGNPKTISKRHTITDDLDKIDELQYSTNFCLTSPISYCGKSRKSTNARFMHALCIEVDSLRQEDHNLFAGLDDLIHQCTTAQFLPKPTYIVASGNGVHLYYVFIKPIPLFKDVAKSIERWKRYITRKMWNANVTTLHQDHQIQYESIFQAFRMVGTLTKRGIEEYEKTGIRSPEEVARAFVFDDGERVSIEYMNSFVKKQELQITTIYKSDLPLTKAKELYPEWYEKRIVQGIKEKGRWVCNRAVYDWWKEKILSGAAVGHRYYCLMCLAIYAIKCNIDYEELEDDCFDLMYYLDTLTVDPKNKFTEEDVISALQIYQDQGYVTYPVNSISNRSGIKIQKNKRNGRKQKEHLQADVWKGEKGRPVANVCKQNREFALSYMRENNQITGRPTKHQQVQEWREQNPNGRKVDCIRALELDKKTVYKWWDIPFEEPKPILDLNKYEMEDDYGLDSLMNGYMDYWRGDSYGQDLTE